MSFFFTAPSGSETWGTQATVHILNLVQQTCARQTGNHTELRPKSEVTWQVSALVSTFIGEALLKHINQIILIFHDFNNLGFCCIKFI